MTPHKDVASVEDVSGVNLHLSYKFAVSFLQFYGADLQPRAGERSRPLSRHRLNSAGGMA
jgi:hypothetical protein